MKHYTFMERYHLWEPCVISLDSGICNPSASKANQRAACFGLPKGKMEFHTLASTHVIRSDKSCENLTTASGMQNTRTHLST